MPRRPNTTPVERVHLTIRKSVLDRIRPHVFDPARQKLRYGELSRLTEALWNDYCDRMEKPPHDTPNASAGNARR